ncbi:hypothetical protein B0H10DRAFT_2437396 [Mycena sp. CBHHK59/15]|nr:hypothetical protein B0H10DRAFT_2437396 [Mycena sp. CBHHK59/15]
MHPTREIEEFTPKACSAAVHMGSETIELAERLLKCGDIENHILLARVIDPACTRAPPWIGARALHARDKTSCVTIRVSTRSSLRPCHLRAVNFWCAFPIAVLLEHPDLDTGTSGDRSMCARGASAGVERDANARGRCRATIHWSRRECPTDAQRVWVSGSGDDLVNSVELEKRESCPDDRSVALAVQGSIQIRRAPIVQGIQRQVLPEGIVASIGNPSRARQDIDGQRSIFLSAGGHGDWRNVRSAARKDGEECDGDRATACV